MKYLARKIAMAFALAAILTAGFALSGGLSSGPSAARAVASLTIGPVTCNLPQYNPTHFAIQPGQTVTCTISDPNLVVNGPVNVNVQSSDFGNTTVGGTGDTGTHTITFTYTAVQNGCNTSIITYDKTADGGGGGVVSTGTGFAYVDTNGNNIACGGQGTTGTTGTTSTGTTVTTTVPVTATATVTTTVPGATTTVPGATTTLPGATTTLPGGTTSVAGATTTVQGQTTTVTNTVTVAVKGATKTSGRPRTTSHKAPKNTG